MKPLQFAVTRGDLFTFSHSEIVGTIYPSRDKIGLDEWVWRLSKSVINCSYDDDGKLLDVKSETVVINEGYASEAGRRSVRHTSLLSVIGIGWTNARLVASKPRNCLD
jgi:hypothetical protein